MKQQVFFPATCTLVVIGQIISLFGNAILHFALPLYLSCGRQVPPRCLGWSPPVPSCPW